MSDIKDHDSDSDSDAPEEYTQEQAKLEDAALRKIQRENKARISREKKERRKLMAEQITPRKSRTIETLEDVEEEEQEEEPKENSEALVKKGFLSKDIIDFLAEREKQKAGSDSEEEEIIDEIPRKKKQKSSGIETVIYKEIPPPECLKNGLDFLKMRRAQVPRSSAVIKNSGQALRLVTGAALAKKQRQRK